MEKKSLEERVWINEEDIRDLKGEIEKINAVLEKVQERINAIENDIEEIWSRVQDKVEYSEEEWLI